jgi:ADP-heptose:LPS heptosyltransferase
MADDLAKCAIARLRILVSPLTPLLHMAAISGYPVVTIVGWVHSKHPSRSEHRK